MRFKLLTGILLIKLLASQYVIKAQNSANSQSSHLRFDPVVAENYALQGAVNAIAQDSKGFMWFGTWSGLYKYDGLKYKLYKPDNKPGSLKDRKIRQIFSDSRGRVWVGTMYEGLHLYDPDTDTFIQFKHDPKNKKSISDNDVLSIFEDRAGNIWIGTVHGLNLVKKVSDGNRFVFQSWNIDALNDGANRINWIYQDHLNRLWVATEVGLYWTNNSADLKFNYLIIKNNHPNSVFYNYIYSIAGNIPGAKNKFWIATRAGVASITYSGDKGNEFEIEHYESGKGENLISHNRVRALLKYDENNLWIATENGLNKLSTDSRKIFSFFYNANKLNSLNSNSVYSLFKDKSGILWIGTEKGLNKLDPYFKQFDLFQSDNIHLGLKNNFITSFASTSPGSLWIGTNGDGLHKMELNSASGNVVIQHYKLVEQNFNKSADFIYCLTSDYEGRIWAGTKGSGIFIFSPDKIRKGSNSIIDFQQLVSDVSDEEALNDDYIISIYTDSNNNIWVGTWSGGILKFDHSKKKFRRFKGHSQYPADLSSYPVTTIREDFKGNIWVGTRGGGIFKLGPEIKGRSEHPFLLHLKNISNTPTSLSSNYVNSIFEDNNKRIWIATESGLNLLSKDETQFTTISEVHGLPNDVVQAIVQDTLGQLWLSTNKGIGQFDPKKAYNLKQENDLSVRVFDQNDGLQGEMYNNDAAFILDDGFVLFGGTNGFNGFYPHQIRVNPYQPEVIFTDFQVFNKSVPVGPVAPGKHTILSKHISERPEITIKPNENAFSFEFAALHFASPLKNKYAYKMEGFDNNWVYTSAKRNFAYYTNLDPGTYRFLVKASNNDGVWSNEASAVTITVLPPFWKTPWAYALYVLFIFAILLVLRKLILLKAEYRHSLSLERVKRENSEYITQLKLHFFTNISHEIRTPMTLIIGSIERLLASSEINARVHDQLLVLQNNGQRLMRLINQLLDFRKIEAGHMKLQAAEGNIVCFLEETYVSFKELAIQRKINFSMDSITASSNVYYDRDKMEKIFFNLLSNAFKYTPDKGSIILNFEEVDASTLEQQVSNKELIKNSEGYVRIAVKDSGIGISEEAIGKIFDLYYQEQHHNGYFVDSVGTGIGLTLTKNLIELHKGFIQVTSKEGQGSTFAVYLPKGTSHLREEEIVRDFVSSESSEHYKITSEFPAPEEKPAEEPVPVSADLPLILVVEDNADVRNFIKQAFEEHYKVLTAANGQEGWELALEHIPDLIISDVVMPVMDGLEFCSKIKKDERTSHIPLILLTARTSLLFKTKGLETGAVDYITKPFNYQVLFQKVQNLVSLKQNVSARFVNKKYLSPKDVTTNSQDEKFLQKAMDIVERNMQDPDFNVENFGKELGMSKMQVYRKLKALTGLSANEFVRNLRIQRAGQLLEKKELNVAEVTYQVGFTDLKYFRKCFKDYFNVNPSEYADKAAELSADKDELKPNKWQLN